ncbi:MAG TPA: zinc finger domain-containing protein [Mycobacteriales bacterium]|nr:zinc finger domain-containing protein [Mycobacteriales bacterium]
MPEGHTIHRLARRHNRLLRGEQLRASSPQGRFTAGAGLIDGRLLLRAEGYGKHLLYDIDGPWTLHVHLGLYGTFRELAQPAPAPVGLVRLRWEAATTCHDLRGPTACELLEPDAVRRLVARLGPDPLRRDADPERAWSALRARRIPIAAALMDQSVLAGIGNVYRAEILFVHGIDPFLAARDLPRESFDNLWARAIQMLRAGVRSGRIVTTEPADRTGSSRASRDDAHYVYRRAGLPCRRCGSEVQSAVLAGRNLYWCPRCQAG